MRVGLPSNHSSSREGGLSWKKLQLRESELLISGCRGVEADGSACNWLLPSCHLTAGGRFRLCTMPLWRRRSREAVLPRDAHEHGDSGRHRFPQRGFHLLARDRRRRRRLSKRRGAGIAFRWYLHLHDGSHTSVIARPSGRRGRPPRPRKGQRAEPSDSADLQIA